MREYQVKGNDDLSFWRTYDALLAYMTTKGDISFAYFNWRLMRQEVSILQHGQFKLMHSFIYVTSHDACFSGPLMPYLIALADHHESTNQKFGFSN